MMLSKLSRLRSILSTGGSSRDVLTVTLGTLLGQGLIILATPILTRLYSPDEMGIYSVYVALVGIFSVTIALHYELAIPLPKNDGEAVQIAKVAIATLIITSAILGFIFWLGKTWILPLVRAEQLKNYVLLIPLGLILWGFTTVASVWATRKRAFAASALSKIGQGAGQTIPQFLFGFLHFGAIGLIIGQLIGGFFSLFFLRRIMPPLRRQSKSNFSTLRLLAVARKYKRFPLLTTASSLINSLSAQLPVLLLAFWFSPEVTGFFALSFRVLQAPLRFVGQSVSQVFFSVAAKSYHSGTLGIVTGKTFQRMMSFSLPSFLILAMISPELFTVVFGENWRTAGEYSQSLMPWIFFSFFTMVLSILVTVTNRQKAELLFQVLYAIVTALALIAGGNMNDPARAMLMLGSLGGLTLFGKTIWLLHIGGTSFRQYCADTLKELPYTLAALGIILLCKLRHPGDLAIVAIGVILLFALHTFNFLIRRSYGFGRANERPT